jgi:hypothetical protein
MTTWYESQVNAHDIDSYSCKDETDTDPETPISMCALPIRNGVFMINCGDGTLRPDGDGA